MSLLVLVLGVSCGSGTTTGAAATSTTMTSFPHVALSSLAIAAVIAAPTHGWIYAGAGSQAGLYRYDSDDEVVQVAALPSYLGPFATFVAGHLVIGGSRCADGTDRMRDPQDVCPAWVAQATRFTPSGLRLGTSLIERINSPPDDTSGISLVGSRAGVLQIATDRGLRGLTPSGAVTRLSTRDQTPAGSTQPTTTTPGELLSVSSTGAWYGLTPDGSLHDRESSTGGRPLEFPAPQPGTVPAQTAVDDSGGSLFACVTESTANGFDGKPGITTTHCQFVPAD